MTIRPNENIRHHLDSKLLINIYFYLAKRCPQALVFGGRRLPTTAGNSRPAFQLGVYYCGIAQKVPHHATRLRRDAVLFRKKHGRGMLPIQPHRCTDLLFSSDTL
jgi:hypothetical protein